jgi:hypothetical protein
MWFRKGNKRAGAVGDAPITVKQHAENKSKYDGIQEQIDKHGVILDFICPLKGMRQFYHDDTHHYCHNHELAIVIEGIIQDLKEGQAEL